MSGPIQTIHCGAVPSRDMCSDSTVPPTQASVAPAADETAGDPGIDTSGYPILHIESTQSLSVQEAETNVDINVSSAEPLETIDLTLPGGCSGAVSAPLIHSAVPALMTGRISESSNARGSVPLDAQAFQYGRIDLLSSWFPEVDPNHPRAKTWRTWSSKQNVLLTTATITALSVLLTNVIATIYIRSKHAAIGGVAPMYEGSCSWVRNVDDVLHLVINILSTLLLGSSNLCMQVLVAPTRNEIDVAHSKQRWLDIGVPSWRNLRNISLSRRLMWWLLGLSSVPLHFIYNSAISSSLASYSYGGAVVTESFLQGAAWGNASAYAAQYFAWPDPKIWNGTEVLMNMQKAALDTQTLVNLSKSDCLNLYTNLYSDRTNMMVVLEDGPTKFNSSLLEWVYRPASWYHTNLGWLCFDGIAGGPFCTLTSRNTQSNFDHWYKYNRPVLYCLNMKTSGERCRLNYSPIILTAICCVSSLKCICVALTAWYFHRQEETPLCTLGDAISSFLEVPDPLTSKMGVVSRDLLDQKEMWRSDAKSVLWEAKRRRWYSSASKRRWIFTMSLCGIATVVATYAMASGAMGTMHRVQTNSFGAIMHLGFGRANPAAFTAYFLSRTGTQGFVENVIWANIWQMIISMLYLAYNGLLTCQLVSEEWAGYAKDRKTLRVSHPKGIQRSTYFVSMPMKYGIPLLIANAILHWLISQSTFLVSTTTYYPNSVEDTSQFFTTTGYSTSAAIISICFGLFMLVAFVINSFRVFSNAMPLVSTSSAAISAACHRPQADREAYLLPVQWGIIGDGQTGSEGGHCCFTTDRHVRPPEEGELVLGLQHLATDRNSVSRSRYAFDGWWHKIMHYKRARKTE